jgi:hypothetical protein
MKDYHDIHRFKKRVRALVGPLRASQYLKILATKAHTQARDAFFVKIII